MKNELSLRCDCLDHHIDFLTFEKTEEEGLEEELFISVEVVPRSFWDRIREAWKGLRDNKRFYEEIILDREKAVQLKEWLIQNVG